MVTSVMSIYDDIRVESTIYTKLISVCFTVNNSYYRCTRSCTMPHRGKNKCIDGLSSDNFKNGTHFLNVYISLLFSSMLVHGTAPAGLLLFTLVPLIKNKRGNKCDSNNYRVIAISTGSLLGKLFDIIILKGQCTSLTTDVLQF